MLLSILGRNIGDESNALAEYVYRIYADLLPLVKHHGLKPRGFQSSGI